MRGMTIKEVQNFGLSILKDVNQFCVSHGIKYTLAYGTLIGAIRHQGFIPWDDDIDILLPRPDFDRFCREYKSKSYKIIPPDSQDSYLAFARVFDDKLTRVETRCPWCSRETGVWIDIFPLDGMPSDTVDFRKQVEKLKRMRRWELMLRSGKLYHDYRALSAIQFMKCMVKKIICVGWDIRKVVESHVAVLKANDFDTCEFCGQLCDLVNPEAEHNPKSEFSDYVLKEFEGELFYVNNGFDSQLRRMYGDYMQYPPLELRHPHTGLKYYWL